jgi:hypothetical protein
MGGMAKRSAAMPNASDAMNVGGMAKPALSGRGHVEWSGEPAHHSEKRCSTRPATRIE